MAVKGKTILRIVAIVVVAGVFAWQYLHGRRADTAKASAPAASTAAASVAATPSKPLPPLPPKTWKLGSLTLTSCELGGSAHGGRGASVPAWCAKFDVPENRADPDGRHIKLNVAVVRAEAAVADDDIVVLLAGGPGEAATEAVHVAKAFPELHKRHHFLLLDQRGTGHSNPLDCKVTEDKAQLMEATLDLDRLRENVASCLTEVSAKADPRYYTTTVAAEDLEDVRKALGSPQFDLLGVSYGTRMAQQYLMRHPDGVRSVVLDSPVPNPLVLGQDFAVNLDTALKKDFALCTATPACKQRFGDPMHTLYQLRDALRANPHKVSFRDPATFVSSERMLSQYSLAAVVRMFAYTPATAALLPLAIDAAAHGNVGPLLGQATLISGDLDDDITNGMGWSVICSEDADMLQDRPQDADTILGNTLVDAYQTICSVWPHGTRPADFHAPLKSDKPILLLSGELDPVTPPDYGRQILAGLSDARQLVLKGQGHAVMMTGCTPKLIGKFIDTLQPAELDASCLDKLGPTPAFINFNGAAP